MATVLPVIALLLRDPLHLLWVGEKRNPANEVGESGRYFCFISYIIASPPPLLLAEEKCVFQIYENFVCYFKIVSAADECEICTATTATIALSCARQSLARAVFGPITECLYEDTFTPFILHRIVILQLFSATRRVSVSLTTAILSFDLILFIIALVLTVNSEVALQRLVKVGPLSPMSALS